MLRRRPGLEYFVDPECEASLPQTADFSEFTLIPTYTPTDKQDGFALHPYGNR